MSCLEKTPFYGGLPSSTTLSTEPAKCLFVNSSEILESLSRTPIQDGITVYEPRGVGLTLPSQVSYEDVDRLKGLAVTENMRVPHFLQDQDRYMEHLEKIMEVNELTDRELRDLIY